VTLVFLADGSNDGAIDAGDPTAVLAGPDLGDLRSGDRVRVTGKVNRVETSTRIAPDGIVVLDAGELPGAPDRTAQQLNTFTPENHRSLEEDRFVQAEGRVAMYNNVFINPYGDAVHIQPHNDIPREMDIFYNTVLARDAGIVVRQKPSSDEHYSQRVEGNLIAAGRPIQGGEAAHNVTLPFQENQDKLYPASRLSAVLLKAARTAEKVPRTSWARFAAYPDWDWARPDPAYPGAMGNQPDVAFEGYLNGR